MPTNERFERALPFDEYVLTVKKHEAEWGPGFESTTVSDEVRARLDALPGPRRLLILAEDWCGDAAATVPVIARLAAESNNVEARILRRDEHLDLMDANLVHGGRAIPIVLVFDDEMSPLGVWGPRPAAAQAIFRERLRTFDGSDWPARKAHVYQPVMDWYALDRGVQTMQEVLMELERGGALRD